MQQLNTVNKEIKGVNNNIKNLEPYLKNLDDTELNNNKRNKQKILLHDFDVGLLMRICYPKRSYSPSSNFLSG